MSDNGFIQITHELFRCDEYLSAPADQCKVLTTIFDRACFSPCTQNDHGVDIHLTQGQFMTTHRELGDLSGTDADVVERAIKRFTKCEILRHEKRHRKSILTILWGVKYEMTTPRSTPTLRQDYAIKEDNKTIDSIDLIDNARARIEILKGETGMDKLVIVRCRSQSGIKTLRESQVFQELEPLGYSREAIREAIIKMVEFNPTLNNNAKITNYIKSILEKTLVEQKKGKQYGKDSKKRPSQQDSLRRTRETITKSSCREPCRS